MPEGWRDVDELAEALRAPLPRRDGAVDAIVREAAGGVEAVEASAVPRGEGDRPRPPRRGWRGAWAWLADPRLRLSPLSAAGWAAAVAVAALWLAPEGGPGAPDGASGGSVRHQFVLVAPDALSVSVVGDFNQWDVEATRLVRSGDVWTAEVSLPVGRHVYSFVVDGEEWRADAEAPRAPADDFGRPSSVLLLASR